MHLVYDAVDHAVFILPSHRKPVVIHPVLRDNVTELLQVEGEQVLTRTVLPDLRQDGEGVEWS